MSLEVAVSACVIVRGGGRGVLGCDVIVCKSSAILARVARTNTRVTRVRQVSALAPVTERGLARKRVPRRPSVAVEHAEGVTRHAQTRHAARILGVVWMYAQGAVR